MITDDGRKIVCRNRKAYYDFLILDKLEAGLVLAGSEVKSLADSHCSIGEAWVKVEKGEAWLIGATIDQYKYSNEEWSGHEPSRNRKLLLHKKEIIKLIMLQQQQKLTIIPLEIFFKKGYAKVLIGTAKGKNKRDKRDSIQERDLKRFGY